MDKGFSLVFNGVLQPGRQRPEVLQHLTRLTNLSEDELLDTLFAVKPVIIHTTDDEELADTFHSAFSAAGLCVEIKPWSEELADWVDAEIDFAHFAPLERQETSANYEISLEEETIRDEEAFASGGQLVFSGQLRDGLTREIVIENLAHLTASTENAVLENFFSVIPVSISRHPDLAAAQEYIRYFSEAGLILDWMEPIDPDLPRNWLHPRQDQPTQQLKRPVSQFFYLLSGLIVLAFGAWTLINHYVPGLFESADNNAPIAVELVMDANTSLDPATEPSPDPVTPETNKLPLELPEPETSPPLPAVSEPPLKKPEITEASKVSEVAKVTPVSVDEPSVPTTQPDSVSEFSALTADTNQVELNYFIELLNHFARYGQGDANQKNLAGNIKLTLIINKKGDLVEVTTENSSSQALTDEALAMAHRASPYPPIPDSIGSTTYQWTLPLEYQQEN